MGDQRTERLAQLAAAAGQGNIAVLYNLIGEDAYLLEHIDHVPFFDTPLHKAASAGHIPFAMEMMRLMPSFARKLDPNGFSPIHLALQINDRRERDQMVCRFLEVDGDLVCVKKREGITPLHYVAETGDEDLDLLAKFLSVCPRSIKDVTIRNETVLHIALKSKKLKAFEYMMRWLRKNKSKNDEFWESTILNWKDDEGNTILHVAVSNNQAQAVRLLIKSGVNINSKNLEDKTARDILTDQTQVRIRVMLCPPTVTSFYYNRNSMVLSMVSFLKVVGMDFIHQRNEISEDRGNALLVIASLLITITYQGILSPPGGIWQDDYLPKLTNHTNTTEPAIRNLRGIPIAPGFEFPPTENIAGTPIGYRLYPFLIFLIFNSVTFVLSHITILLLIPPTYIYAILRLAFLSLFVCYCASLEILIPFLDDLFLFNLSLDTFIFLLLGHFLLLVRYLIHRSRRIDG